MHAPEVPLDAFTPPDGRLPVIDSLMLYEDEVYKVLSNLDPSKASCPDGLPTTVLKACARELTPSLCALFNLSLAEGRLPIEWKDTLVVPVYKKGKKEDVTNYRLINLLCVVSKVLERCILKHFNDFLCPLFDNVQHGFLQGRSTVTQLLAFYHEIGQSLDKGLQSDIVYLDLAKGFDSVSHQGLLLKLSQYGVSGKLLQWFDSYLDGRGQQCLVHGFTYSRSPVPSGAPQGSIPGPLLFLVYVNDLLLVIPNHIALFADDSKCSSVIGGLQDCESLQKDLDSLQGWSDNWHLKFNTCKCEGTRSIVCPEPLFSVLFCVLYICIFQSSQFCKYGEID
ncbi:RNA-directed DNA polymerase from mobile element jockey [Stylophora pistillata]|uniref:RNA-directed DNA polymerase from mobile element jockey n=1 Tax=Stylophora pistillata TaxID=50429 RepID=A0A2B4R8S7_STYPI|nr:RNA-directed DNA polymerase from mobile element jockey [Stylophora pistillata]